MDVTDHGDVNFLEHVQVEIAIGPEQRAIGLAQVVPGIVQVAKRWVLAAKGLAQAATGQANVILAMNLLLYGRVWRKTLSSIILRDCPFKHYFFYRQSFPKHCKFQKCVIVTSNKIKLGNLHTYITYFAWRIQFLSCHLI